MATWGRPRRSGGGQGMRAAVVNAGREVALIGWTFQLS